MIFLLLRFTLRHLVREWLRTGLVVGGVALGVAVFLAIRLANTSVLAAFAVTVDAIAGKANLEVSSPSGLDERLFPRILAFPGVIAAAPMVEAVAPLASLAKGQGIGRTPGTSRTIQPTGNRAAAQRLQVHVESPSVYVLGIDPFRQLAFSTGETRGTPSQADDLASTENRQFLVDPLAVEVTTPLALSLGIHRGGSLHLIVGAHTRDLRVVGVLPPDPLSRAYGGKLAVMDIAAAQEVFERLGLLDRVLLLVEPGAVGAVQAGLRRVLPPGTVIQRPGRRTTTVEHMLGAFQLNLEALSGIALFVGMFLIYNTLSSAVVRRRGELGILRGLGLSRPAMSALVLVEAVLIGGLGSAAGLGLGYGMATGLLGAIATTVSSLYVRVEATTIHAPPALFVTAWLIGLGASVLAATVPAAEAAAIDPSAVIRQGSQVRLSRLRWAFFVSGSLSFLALAGVFTFAAYHYNVPWLSFVAAFSLLFGFSLLSPPGCVGAVKILRLFIRPSRAVALWTGVAFFRSSLERVWIVVAALSASVAMLVGLSTMVGSFRLTVGQWVGQTIVGDVYVSPASLAISGSTALMPAGAGERARRIPGVAAVDEYRFIAVSYEGREVSLVARRLPILVQYPSYRLRQGRLADAGLGKGDQVLVSGTFADEFHRKVGDPVVIPAPSGATSYRIAGIFNDYTTDQGVVVMSLEQYRRRRPDPAVNSLALYASPGTSASVIASRADAVFHGLSLNIRTNAELRREILRIFDQTFRITYALEIVAVLVALLGIASTLITLILQRSRQLATLRAVGASQVQVVAAVMVEAGLIGTVAWLLGSVCGTALACELIYVVLPGFFHWTVEMALEPGIFAWSLALIIPASLIAAVFPAMLASRVEISRALRSE